MFMNRIDWKYLLLSDFGANLGNQQKRVNKIQYPDAQQGKLNETVQH